MPEELDELRKAYEEAQEGFRMAIFEALRAPTLNRYKVEDAFKKYLEKQNAYLLRMHGQIIELAALVKH